MLAMLTPLIKFSSWNLGPMGTLHLVSAREAPLKVLLPISTDLSRSIELDFTLLTFVALADNISSFIWFIWVVTFFIGRVHAHTLNSERNVFSCPTWFMLRPKRTSLLLEFLSCPRVCKMVSQLTEYVAHSNNWTLFCSILVTILLNLILKISTTCQHGRVALSNKRCFVMMHSECCGAGRCVSMHVS